METQRVEDVVEPPLKFPHTNVDEIKVVAEVAVQSQPEAGLATKSSNDRVADRTQTQGSQSTTEEVVKSSSNGQAARLREERAEANGKEVHLPSIQSPASALADTLSALSLATPAVNVTKASRLQDVFDQREGFSELAVEEPANAQEGDAAVGLVYDKVMEEHVGPPSHVERPQRTAALVQKLRAAGLAARCWTLPPRKARDDELVLAHTEAHVRHVDGPPKDDEWQIGDNYYSAATPLAARTAAGCTVQAVDAVCSGQVQRAFAVVRPPGHHAECARAMGFCFFNNVAVAALAARKAGANKVLVLDWDVHHGNGIEEILYGNADIMYISTHRGNGFYPGTGDIDDIGEGAGRGFNLNIPFPRGGFNDADYIAAFDLVLEPIIGAFAPDLIIVSAGYDAVQGDPLGGMNLTPQVYGHMTERLARLAAGGRLVLALEGGYNLRMTAECGAECVKVLLGAKPEPLDTRGAWRPAKETGQLLARVAAAQAPFWPVLAPLSSQDGFDKAWDEYLLTKQTEAALQLRRSPRAKAAV
ncbi:g8330 [Coccomyxa elongata]